MSRWLFRIGILALIVGIGGLVGAFQPLGPAPLTDVDTVTVPSGADLVFTIEYSVSQRSSMNVNYSETSGRTLIVHVFDKPSYDDWISGISATSLYMESGASGDFEVELPSRANYVLVFQHGAGNEDVDQTVDYTARIEPIVEVPNMTVLGVGIGALVVGILMIVGGLKLRGRAAAKRMEEELAKLVPEGEAGPPAAPPEEPPEEPPE